MTIAPRYIDMTAEERRLAFDAILEADADMFIGLDARAIARSKSAFDMLQRERRFLGRVAKSRGDEWAKSPQYRDMFR